MFLCGYAGPRPKTPLTERSFIPRQSPGPAGELPDLWMKGDEQPHLKMSV